MKVALLDPSSWRRVHFFFRPPSPHLGQQRLLHLWHLIMSVKICCRGNWSPQSTQHPFPVLQVSQQKLKLNVFSKLTLKHQTQIFLKKMGVFWTNDERMTLQLEHKLMLSSFSVYECTWHPVHMFREYVLLSSSIVLLWIELNPLKVLVGLNWETNNLGSSQWRLIRIALGWPEHRFKGHLYQLLYVFLSDNRILGLIFTQILKPYPPPISRYILSVILEWNTSLSLIWQLPDMAGKCHPQAWTLSGNCQPYLAIASLKSSLYAR